MKMIFMKVLSVTIFVFVLFCLFACLNSNANPITNANKKLALFMPVLLCVSFGTSHNDNRDLSIGAVEKALRLAFPNYELRRAFTSQIIINKLKKRDNIIIDNVKEAMDKLVADGVKELIVQPTHVMSGFEYDDVVEEVSKYKDKFESCKLSSPLLANDKDFKCLVKVLISETKSYNNKDTAIVWMGHGTEHRANAVYEKMQETFFAAGYKNYFVGTVESHPNVEDVLARVKKISAKKVVLLPLMIVAGDHAKNDMAGDDEDSWKTIFKKAGYNVEPVLKGLGEYTGVQQMIVDHAKETVQGESISL
ncbi:MAG: sirohydrochlorin cobaltochelatase [Treponemataceae bacterium]